MESQNSGKCQVMRRQEGAASFSNRLRVAYQYGGPECRETQGSEAPGGGDIIFQPPSCGLAWGRYGGLECREIQGHEAPRVGRIIFQPLSCGLARDQYGGPECSEI